MAMSVAIIVQIMYDGNITYHIMKRFKLTATKFPRGADFTPILSVVHTRDRAIDVVTRITASFYRPTTARTCTPYTSTPLQCRIHTYWISQLNPQPLADPIQHPRPELQYTTMPGHNRHPTWHRCVNGVASGCAKLVGGGTVLYCVCSQRLVTTRRPLTAPPTSIPPWWTLPPLLSYHQRVTKLDGGVLLKLGPPASHLSPISRHVKPSAGETTAKLPTNFSDVASAKCQTWTTFDESQTEGWQSADNSQPHVQDTANGNEIYTYLWRVWDLPASCATSSRSSDWIPALEGR